jgi:hypothetical protein
MNTILLSDGIISSDNTPIEQSFISTPTPTVPDDSRQRSVRRCSTLPRAWVQALFNILQSVLYVFLLAIFKDGNGNIFLRLTGRRHILKTSFACRNFVNYASQRGVINDSCQFKIMSWYFAVQCAVLQCNNKLRSLVVSDWNTQFGLTRSIGKWMEKHLTHYETLRSGGRWVNQTNWLTRSSGRWVNQRKKEIKT